MWNTNVSDGYGNAGYGGGWGGYGGGGLFGGATGGAFVGGLAGSLIGDAFFPGGRGRGGVDGACGGEKVVQINENAGKRGGWGCEIGEWETMKEICDTHRDVVAMPYITENAILQQTIAINDQMADTNAHIGALQMQLCQCCNETQRLELEGQYKAAMIGAGISREMAECCCKQLQATTVMGFETQLRDQANFGALMTEMAEVKCLIKDTSKDEYIRFLENKGNTTDLKLLKEEIIAAMKPVAPVPAYIQGNPYENFRPVVRVENDRDRCCDDRWSNCRGFQ